MTEAEAQADSPAKPVQTTPSRADKSCTVDKCKRRYRAKGYCNVHYRKWRHGDLPKGRYKICEKEDCKKPRLKGALCEEHQPGKAAE